MLRYLALLLLAPWLLVLAWAYFAYPKSLPRTAVGKLSKVELRQAEAARAKSAAGENAEGAKVDA